MDGDYRASDGGPWTACAECGATIPADADAWDEWGIYHEAYCAECVAAMAADETDETAGR